MTIALHLEAFRVYTVQPAGMPVRQCYTWLQRFRVSCQMTQRLWWVALRGSLSRKPLLLRRVRTVYGLDHAVII